jgi:hypothetical protein
MMRIHPLKYSTAAIGSQLKEDGWLILGSSNSHLPMQIRVRGWRVRVWRLEAELFRGACGDADSRRSRQGGDNGSESRLSPSFCMCLTRPHAP